MNDRHEGFSHAARIRVLNNVAAVDKPEAPWAMSWFRTMSTSRSLAFPPPRTKTGTLCGLNYLMIYIRVVGRIGLDHVRA